MINGYVAAGYGLIWGSIAWYTWRSWRRLRAAERQLGAVKRESNSETR